MEEFYESDWPGLLRYCITLAHDDSAAQDLAQETFLKFWTHIGDLGELKPEQRKAWLRKTAHNLWIDSVRKSRRMTFPGEEELELASCEEDFTWGEVAWLLDRLPPEEGSLFRLRYFEGYNATELGELFDLPPGTVRSRLSSARRKLKKWLKE